MIKLYTALLKFQKEVPTIIKDKNNPFFKSKYSDLSSVINGVQETLTKCELGIIHSIETANEINVLTTILFHSSGESITSRITIPPQNDAQKLGSLITYLKRYSYMAILGVASEEDDDDANGATNKKKDNYKQSNNQSNDNAPKADDKTKTMLAGGPTPSQISYLKTLIEQKKYSKPVDFSKLTFDSTKQLIADLVAIKG
jgi:hypothetical protein